MYKSLKLGHMSLHSASWETFQLDEVGVDPNTKSSHFKTATLCIE